MVNKRKFHNKSLLKKQEKVHDPGLMAAVEMASYQLQTKKKAIKELTVNREVQNLLQANRGDVVDEFTAWLYGAFALALHRKCGFGAKRVATLLEELRDIKNDLIEQEIYYEEIWDIVRDEVGIDIVVD